MKIFTVVKESVLDRAEVTSLTLASGVNIPAITVGEDGRGRKLGVVPTVLLPNSLEIWENKKSVWINNVRIGQTGAGKAKFFEKEQDNDTDCVVVMRSDYGYRGVNYHGARIVWEINEPYCTVQARFKNGLFTPELSQSFEKYMENTSYASYDSVEEFVNENSYTTVQGNIEGVLLASGHIADGMAGRVAGGDQYIYHIKDGTTFAVKMTGRMYGNPDAYEYVFSNGKITAYTARDLEIID